MDWHIITSSKGGVGKTLISTMLSAYSRINGEVLIIDLNGMNADLRRLVVGSSAGTRPVRLKLAQIGDFYLERMHNSNYIIGWPEDSFQTLDAARFRDFFAQISNEVKHKIRIEKNLGCADVNTVIIDTSYHFCNIFSGEDRDYKQEPFNSLFKKDNENIFIWFIWVYRQINNLIIAGNDPHNPHHVDARTMVERAMMIESNIKNDKLGNSPFVHVFSPISVGQVISEKGFLDAIFKWDKNKNLASIEPLKKLAALDRGESVAFSTFIFSLKQAQNRVRKMGIRTKDVHEFFLKVLDAYGEERPAGVNRCPRNVLPLHMYQKDLLGYTEADYNDLLDKIYDQPVYRNSFEQAYSALLNNGGNK